MRGFVTFMAIVAIGGGLFAWQKHNQQPGIQSSRAAQNESAPRQTYEHDWAKHSLDTTHAVIDQIQHQRKDDDLKDAVGRR
jgi:hypothetical protein